MAHITATHLELIEGRHNKYYRVYAVTPSGEGAPQQHDLLVKNFGRRGTAGQWQVSTAPVGQAYHTARETIWGKQDKGYVSIASHGFDAELDPESLNQKDMGGLKETLTDGFAAVWAEQFRLRHPLGENPDPRLVLLTGRETAMAANPAVAALTEEISEVLYETPCPFIESVEWTVVRTTAGAVGAITAAFGPSDTPVAAAKPEDGSDTAEMAVRLYSPDGAAAYSFAEAVEAARAVT